MKPESDTPLHHPTINKVFIDVLFDYMDRTAGASTEHFLSSLKLQRSLIDEYEQVPMSLFLLLMEEASKFLKDPNLGLHYYEKLDYRRLGVFGYALINSKTLGDALNLVIRYYCLFQDHMEFCLTTNDKKAFLSYRITAKNLPPSRQDSEMTLMAVRIFIRDCIDQNWSPDEAYFQHAAPADISEHKRVICDKLYFNHDCNKLVFDKSWLDHTVREADPLLSQSLVSTLDQLLKLRQQNSEHSWLDELKKEIAEQMVEGAPSIEKTADRMHLSRRTLQRKLALEGLTFKDCIEQIRHELATNYLSASEMPVQDIAFLLGYSDSASFTRAFKRWTEQTPLEYRSQRRIS